VRLRRRAKQPESAADNPLGLSKPGITFRDMVSEAGAGLLARPGRAALTVLGTVIGVAALVATLGVSRTASSQIVSRFDRLAATDVSITPRTKGSPVIPWDAASRLTRLNGVVAAGTLGDVDAKGAVVRSVPINDPLGQQSYQLPIKAASPGLFAAVRAELASGRLFDVGHSNRADRVAVLGPAAAQRLNLVGVEQQPAIYVGDHLYLVVGILTDVARQADLLGAVIIPEGTAQAEFGLAAPSSVQIETQVGAAQLIAQQAPIAVSPSDQTLLKVTSPPDPKSTKNAVKSDLNTLFLILGLVSLLVGAIGIANVTLVSVLERGGEIGLRRALGAGRGHIAGQFLAESVVMGLVGGIIGASIGIFVVIGVSLAQQWTPVIDPLIPLQAPVLGAITGLLAGLYPSVRAALLEPVDALRAGT
jgi:ABC-type antimicrobial peptide transport system permease subunit